MVDSLPPPGRWKTTAPIVAAIVVVVLTAIYPGDAQFVHDEPYSVGVAMRATADGKLAQNSAVGLLGLRIAPVGLQFNQLLMRCFDDVVLALAARALIYAGVTAAALIWLGLALRLNLWFVPVVLATPLMWYHARMLWDNLMLMPLGAGLLAGYANLLLHRSRAAAVVTAGCGVLLPLIHPMSAALVLAVGVHAVVFHRPALFARRWALVLTAVVCCATIVPYFIETVGSIMQGRSRQAYNAPADDPDAVPYRPFWLHAAGWPWTGATLLTADHAFARLDARDIGSKLLRVARPLGWIAHGLFGVGVVAAALGRRRAEPGVRASVGRAALMAMLIQTVVFAAARPQIWVHYLFGVGAAVGLLTWLGADELLRRRRISWLFAVYGISVVTATLVVSIALHRSQGTRFRYGPNVRQLAAIGAEARQNSVGTVWTNIRHLQTYPAGLWVFLEWPLLHGAAMSPAPGRVGVVEFVSDDPFDARIRLRIADSAPRGYARIWSLPATAPAGN